MADWTTTVIALLARLRSRLGARYVPVLVVLALTSGVVGSQLYAFLWGRAHAPKYKVARVERGALTASVVTNGTVKAVMSVQVGSLVSGRLKEILVDFNSVVKKNQLMARIDPESFEAKVIQARAQLEAAQATVLNQRAFVERTRADIANARATLAATNAQIADAQAQGLEAKRQFDRRVELLRRELIAPSELDTAKASYDSAEAKVQAARAQALAQGETIRAVEAQRKVAEAQLRAAVAQVAEKDAVLRQAQVDLQNTRIVAPVDGIVVARHVDVGETMAAMLQTPLLFTIAEDLTQMQVHANVDEADIGEVRVGQNATFTVDAFRNQTFTGVVSQIRKTAQVVQSVVTYVAVISASNPELKLLPGMTASVRIVVDRKERVLKVPNAALRFRPPEEGIEHESGSAQAAEGEKVERTTQRTHGADGTMGHVWIFSPAGRPQAVTVRVGSSDGVFSELVSGGLAEGQKVLVGMTDPTGAGSGRRGLGPRAPQRI